MQEHSTQIARRREHARQELTARGILKNGRYPPGPRLLMRLIPTLKPPYYGDYAIYGLLMAVLFGLPFVAILTVVFRLDDSSPTWPGPVLGIAAGAAFGVLMVGFMASVARRTRLTPWDALDTPPGDAPEGAASYREVETDFMRRPFRLGRGGRDTGRERGRK